MREAKQGKQALGLQSLTEAAADAQGASRLLSPL